MALSSSYAAIELDEISRTEAERTRLHSVH